MAENGANNSYRKLSFLLPIPNITHYYELYSSPIFIASDAAYLKTAIDRHISSSALIIESRISVLRPIISAVKEISLSLLLILSQYGFSQAPSDTSQSSLLLHCVILSVFDGLTVEAYVVSQ